MTPPIPSALRAALILLASAAPLAAQAPRSAIPWLSESVSTGPAPAAAPGGGSEPASGFRPSAGVSGSGRGDRGMAEDGAGLATPPVEVTALSRSTGTAVGVLPPDTTGYSAEMWGPTTAEEALGLLEQAPSGALPETRAMLIRLLLAETAPPEGGAAEETGSALLQERIDRLLLIGAVEQADALMRFAEPGDPELFRRWFDIGLLTNAAEAPCERLRRNPTLSPTLPARVFCLARGGDWNAAEITLSMGTEVGSIEPERVALLARFLDPDLFEGEPEPEMPDPLTPLDFVMREAVGLSRPGSGLPLAFLHWDLVAHTPMRIRAEAAERLTLSGAIGEAPLFAAYRDGEPAASGGVWDRAASVQAFDAALQSGSAPEIGESLAALDAAMREAGLRVALARAHAPALVRLDPAGLSPAARATVFELLLLAGEADDAIAFMPDAPSAEQRTAAAISRAGTPATQTPPDDAPGPLARAIRDAFGGAPPEDNTTRELLRELEEGREAEALLDSLALLADGERSAPASVQAALSVLVAAGQEDAARQIALEILLGGGRPLG